MEEDDSYKVGKEEQGGGGGGGKEVEAKEAVGFGSGEKSSFRPAMARSLNRQKGQLSKGETGEGTKSSLSVSDTAAGKGDLVKFVGTPKAFVDFPYIRPEGTFERLDNFCLLEPEVLNATPLSPPGSPSSFSPKHARSQSPCLH